MTKKNTKKLAIMQPYLFPYIGYWQLLYAVDKLVILDDVNYIVRGYINRNSILLDGKAHMFSIPIEKASQNKLILETKLNFSMEEKRKFLNKIAWAYKKAPEYTQVMPLIESIILYTENDLTNYIRNSILEIKDYLKIETLCCKSSEIEKDNSLHAQDKILEICQKEEADCYINPRGGRKLYQAETFAQKGMELRFLETRTEKIRYKQFHNEFVENLSIIDVMMFNKKEGVIDFLKEYDLNE